MGLFRLASQRAWGFDSARLAWFVLGVSECRHV
jgi:hypothetical protein